MRIGKFITAAMLGGVSFSAASAQFWTSPGDTRATQPTSVGQCLNGRGQISETELGAARSAAKSLMDDYWLLALVSDNADVTPAFQPAGALKWIDGSATLTGAELKHVRDTLARNSELTMSSQPISFALAAAGNSNRARGIWSVYPRSDPSRVEGYYIVDFTRVTNRWGASQVQIVRAPSAPPVARPFCVEPGDIEIAAAVRSNNGTGRTDSRSFRETSAPAITAPVADTQYRISKGDKIRITTFGEDRFSGEFLVHGDGKITFPLFGELPASGLTTPQLVDAIKSRLTPDYLRDPQVTAEVVSFRPVYILGEVAKPGQYPYSEGMTMYALIAQAGGFSYRANSKRAYVRHDGQGAEQRVDIQSSTAVIPGDTIRIGQRIF